MGLDMRVISVDRKDMISEFEFNHDTSEHTVFEWRKHPNLHGWMRNLYIHLQNSLGKSNNIIPGRDTYMGEGFNGGIYVRLEEDDIDRLKHDVNNDLLPETTGFFFGKSGPMDKEDDLKFIKVAKAELAQGKVIYYTSSW